MAKKSRRLKRRAQSNRANCTVKLAYPTRAAALRAANAIYHRYVRWLKVYRCDNCSQWHLGDPNAKSRRLNEILDNL